MIIDFEDTGGSVQLLRYPSDRHSAVRIVLVWRRGAYELRHAD